MRQVPSYLLVGSGRVASHFQCYLRFLKLPFSSWSRQKNTEEELLALSESASVILLLISDKAITEFIERRPFLKNKQLVHCSGSLSLATVPSAHPLMTFGSETYDLEVYQKMPFILSQEAPAFSQLLPGLPNAAYHLEEQARPYYHALCVLSGNFTALLWQKCFKEFETRFHLPSQVAHPYLEQVMRNLMQNAEQALTGPLARGDQKTLATNLQALEGDAFQPVYQAFVAAYQNQRGEQK